MSESSYVCTLTVESEKKAKKELGEDPKERVGAVAALREWVEREPWIQAPTDPTFLLSFLRCGKFSQLKARERLANFISCLHTTFPTSIGKDPGCDTNLEFIRKTQSYMILPGTDKDGRKIILGQYGTVDTSGQCYSFDDWMGSFAQMFMSLMFFDEDFQVNGAVFLMDFGDMSLQMLTFVGIDSMRKQSEFTNNAIPMRIKCLCYFNTGPVFEALMAVFRPMLSKKLQDRIQVFGNKMTSVYNFLDKSLLPAEYLPDEYTGPCPGKIADIIESNIKEYILEPTRRAYLKELFSGKYKADLSQRDTSTEVQASFRKLNVS